MHEYDTTLKNLLCNGRESLRELTSVDVERWHNVELPEVRSLRVDLLGESRDTVSSTSNCKALTMPRWPCSNIQPPYGGNFGRFPEQVVLYVGEAPLRMTGGLVGPNFSFECRIVDIRDLDSTRLLASPRIEDKDNIVAVLTRMRDQRATVKQILTRIASADPARRMNAMAGFMIVAGLRRLGEIKNRRRIKCQFWTTSWTTQCSAASSNGDWRKAGTRGGKKVAVTAN